VRSSKVNTGKIRQTRLIRAISELWYDTSFAKKKGQFIPKTLKKTPEINGESFSEEYCI